VGHPPDPPAAHRPGHGPARLACVRAFIPIAPGLAVPPTLAATERTQILAALDQTGWRIREPTGAAALLGLKPTTLESRLKKLGHSRPR